ncbi:unnamed protein product [Ilex paraguariensis]|uniref:SURP motif domain-containing protein n=1 Tax=Ilex paraguariensis TaxID=185542 RepID=A0ABC8TE51_9AQUA
MSKPSFFLSFCLFFQPPSEKVHQIIARTALFVSKHGGQSEFILRVKQGDNPTFGFLMPDHHLHAYFRFLVDHPEVLQFDIDGKPQSGEQKTGTEHNQTDGVGGGALSLLGSVYGSGEDEDGASEDASEYKEKAAAETLDALSATVSHGSEMTESRVNVATKDEPVYRHPFPSKEKAPVLKRNSFNSVSKAGITSSMRKDDTSGSFSAALDKLQASSVAMSKIEPVLLEPPSDLKRLVDKIVEFIMKNGKQFEAVLIEQDSKHGRFPFLLPSNQYHPYYLKLLQKAQESKSTGKSFLSEKDDSVKTSLSKASDVLSLETGGCDVPFDSDRKEKFKMVIGKSKKEGQDPLSKATQPQFGVSVDAAAAAAILQAATRGMKYPNLDILSSTFPNCNRHDDIIEGGREGSLPSSQPESVIQKSNKNAESSIALHVTKPISKLPATEAGSEAYSSEAHLTKEQKLKAERLKRAKMFVAVLKNGAAPSKTEPLRGLSVEPQESGVSGFGAEVNLAAKERESSSDPLAINTSDKNHKSERKNPGDEFNERRSRRKYRTRSGRRHDDEEEGEEEEEERERKRSRKKHRSHRSSHVEDDEEEIDEDDERDNKHSKKHRSHRSSHADDGDESEEMDHKRSRRKHRSHHTSREDEDKDERYHTRSKKKHRSPHSSHDEDDEEEDYEGVDKKEHSRKKHRSHHSSHHSRDRHKKSSRHSSSKDRESRRLHENDSSTHEEHQHHDKSDKHRKRSHSDGEELEEGEISSKISDQSRGSVGVGPSREASVDLSSYRDRRDPSQASEVTEVSEDLRAKIRAMLMATL